MIFDAIIWVPLQLNNDPIGISGGLNQYVFCANNPVNFRDPFGLYLWEVQYWANLSVSGNAFQRTAGYVLGMIAATIPDTATLEIRGAAGVGFGGSRGTGYLLTASENRITPYHTTGELAGTPIAGIGLSLSVAWSDALSPSAQDYMGDFHEVSGGFDFASGGAFGSEHWFGLSVGAGHDWLTPAFLNYQHVNYQLYNSETCPKK